MKYGSLSTREKEVGEGWEHDGGGHGCHMALKSHDKAPRQAGDWVQMYQMMYHYLGYWKRNELLLQLKLQL